MEIGGDNAHWASFGVLERFSYSVVVMVTQSSKYAKNIELTL